MATQPDPAPMDRSQIDLYRNYLSKQRDIRRQLATLELQVRQERFKAHLGFLEKMAARAGLELDEMLAEGRRRHKAQQRILDRGYGEIRRQTQELVRQRAEHCKQVRKRYLERHREKLRQRARGGNPVLKFCQPVGDTTYPGHWTDIEEPPPGGMTGGWHPPTPASWSWNDTMEVPYEPPYCEKALYPRAYVFTGETRRDGLRLVLCQNVFVTRSPLQPGRGDFLVESSSVDLHGVGYSEGRIGDPFLGAPGHLGAQMTEISVKLEVFQTEPAGFMQRVVMDDILYAGHGDHSEVVEIDTATDDRTAAPEGLLRLLSPDSGGGEVWVLFTLETMVCAWYEDGHALIDFSEPDYDGLQLGCIELCGNYES